VSFQLHVSLGSVSASSVLRPLTVVEDPEFGETVVSACGQKSFLEGRPVDVLNGSCMTLKKRNVCVEANRFLRAENSDGRGAGPGESHHLPIEGDAVLVRGVGTLDSRVAERRLEVEVSEGMHCFGFYHFCGILLKCLILTGIS